MPQKKSDGTYSLFDSITPSFRKEKRNYNGVFSLKRISKNTNNCTLSDEKRAQLTEKWCEYLYKHEEAKKEWGSDDHNHSVPAHS